MFMSFQACRNFCFCKMHMLKNVPVFSVSLQCCFGLSLVGQKEFSNIFQSILFCFPKNKANHVTWGWITDDRKFIFTWTIPVALDAKPGKHASHNHVPDQTTIRSKDTPHYSSREATRWHFLASELEYRFSSHILNKTFIEWMSAR